METSFRFLLIALLMLACTSDKACFAHGGGGGGHGGGGHGGGFSGGGNNVGNRPANFGNNFDRPNEFGNSFNRTNNLNNNFNHPANIGHDNLNVHDYNANHFNNNFNNAANKAVVPFSGAHPNYGNWYHGQWPGHGNAWWHYRPAAWWTAGFIAGTMEATPWDWGYWPYHNPYCGEAVIVEGTTLDYSQPIVLAQTPTSDSANESAKTDRTMAIFSTSRQAFYAQNYSAALKACEQALALQPSDVVFNEFRGTTLFALKRYKEAAGVVYAVLSVGPGWDWATMSALYPNVDIYTEQLRALEEYVKSNPNDAAAHFLLAYHYLTCNYADAAAKQLKDVVKLNPWDALSSQLLQGLTDKEPPLPTAADQATTTQQSEAKTIAAANLLGSWKAARLDGSSFALTLAQDGTFTWKFSQKDKIQEFAGPYSVADNLLILKQHENPVMIGQITMQGEDKFNFKLPGENAADPGLTFSK